MVPLPYPSPAINALNRKQSHISPLCVDASTKSSVGAQVLCVLSCRNVSVGVGLERGSEILLVVGVVQAVLQLVFLNAGRHAVGHGQKDCGWRDLVEVLGPRGPILKAVQVLWLRVICRDGGEDAVGRPGVLVDGIHQIGDPVLVHVVCKKKKSQLH